MRDEIRIYAHAHSREQARQLVDDGYTAIKTGGTHNCLESVQAIREEVGLAVDLMVDVHGPPWLEHARRHSTGPASQKNTILLL